ncbi:MAG: serine hydrolase domain-containing protein [Ignavibacteria bacterium]
MKHLYAVILVVLLLLINSCSDDFSSSSPYVNVNEIISQLKNSADSITHNTHIPGVVALVVDKKRGFDWIYASGYSDLQNSIASNYNFNFRVGSVTKTMTITVLLQLVSEGKLTLNDKLSKFYPQYPKSDSITIRMLCNMTSRIRNYTGPDFFSEMWANPLKIWSVDELIDKGFANGFDSIPGLGFNYSNTNTILVGKIIQQITNNSLEHEINTRIFQKLNLPNTGFLTSGTELPGLHGRGYFFIDYVPGQDLTEYFDLSWGWAAGSAYSKPRELQRFVEALVRGGLLPDSLQQKRLNEDFYYLNAKDSYGLGLIRHGSFYGHSGDLPGYMTSMYHSNEKDCTIILYYNGLLRETQVEDLLMTYLRILYGNDY